MSDESILSRVDFVLRQLRYDQCRVRSNDHATIIKLAIERLDEYRALLVSWGVQ